MEAFMPRLRRSVHFVPGASEKMLQKSLALPADSLVLDLEDAVTPENKDSARATITSWLKNVDFGRQEKMIRMNPLDTPWGEKDLEVTMQGRPDSYLVPKVRTKDDILAIEALLTRWEKRYGYPQGEVKLVVIATETPQGVLNIKEIATAGPRVDALSWGAEDLSAAIGARRNRDDSGQFLEVFRHARIVTLLAAAAAGVEPLDTVFVDVRDPEGLRRECLDGAWMGFTGKITIHPSQVEVVNEIFSPSPAEVAEAKELLAAFAENRKAGRMAFSFRGQMVDVPHLTRARKILERAELAGIV
jgi:citrate lyase subunit beta / citryl-CoA lyase